MKKDTDIDALMAETWLTVAQLRHGGEVTDGPALYAACKGQVDSVREALERAGYDSESIDHITYAQCALLDETVLNRKPAQKLSAFGTGEFASAATEGDTLRQWSRWMRPRKPGVQRRYRRSTLAPCVPVVPCTIVSRKYCASLLRSLRY